MKQKLYFLSVLALLLSCLLGLSTTVYAEKTDDVARLVIFSAFNAEKTLLREQIVDPVDVTVLGRTFTMGKIGETDILLGLTGVSMTNAAMMTQAVIDGFNVKDIIFSGIAGGVNPNLNIGDVIIPNEWSEYQEMRFQREVAPGDFGEPGSKKIDLPNFGMMFPQIVEVTKKSGTPDEEIQIRWFPVDEKLFGIAEKISPDVMEKCAAPDICLSHEPVLKIGGRGVDGPTFVDNAEFRAWTWENFQADCLSMETAAIAHVCYVNEVPFLGFRSLSDLAGGGPGKNEIKTFFQLAANNSANVLLEFVRLYGEAN